MIVSSAIKEWFIVSTSILAESASEINDMRALFLERTVADRFNGG